METVEHVIIGGGVAGLVLERVLRGTGSVLLDPNPFGYKIGESLIPELFRHPELAALLPRIREMASYTEKDGTTFVSSDAVVNFPLPTRDAGVSMHVYRPEMERTIAEAWGTVARPWRVVDIDWAKRIVHTDQGPIAYRGVVIDCSGPAMVVAKLRDEITSFAPVYATWAYHDVVDADDRRWVDRIAKGGVSFTRYDPRHRAPVSDDEFRPWRPSRTTILTRVMDGLWSWQIPLFDAKRISIGVVSRTAPRTEEEYRDLVAGFAAPCFSLRARPKGEHPLDRVHTRQGFARRAHRAATTGYVLVSDAFAFSDPVYSVGTGFAVNQAITLGERLRAGPWDQEAADTWSARSERHFARARAAFDLWYAGAVTTDPRAARTAQDCLTGALFRDNVTEQYGSVLDDADLPRARDPFQPEIDVAPVTERVKALLADTRAAGWSMLDAVPSVGGIRVRWQWENGPVVTNMLVAANDASLPCFRRFGPLALSYRREGGDPIGLEGLFDTVGRAMHARERAWLDLLGRTAQPS